jgi:hypothetical protein
MSWYRKKNRSFISRYKDIVLKAEAVKTNAVKLGYNVMKGAQNLVSLCSCVVINEECYVVVKVRYHRISDITHEVSHN